MLTKGEISCGYKMLKVSSGIFVELLSYPSCFFFDSSGTRSGVVTWSFASRSKDLSFKFVVYQGLVRNLSPLEDGCYVLGFNLYFL